ncbi:hypothetical protein BC941DRAFT_500494 [Chlamydoabsidia padenii]|nr:hypothetical protein BC941DRAFT_500494 [Chlamydoabsidia padenii]
MITNTRTIQQQQDNLVGSNTSLGRKTRLMSLNDGGLLVCSRLTHRGTMTLSVGDYSYAYLNSGLVEFMDNTSRSTFTQQRHKARMSNLDHKTIITKPEPSVIPKSNIPDRYYTPQPASRRSSAFIQNYTPTPNPETVVLQEHGIVSDKYPCCIGW